MSHCTKRYRSKEISPEGHFFIFLDQNWNFMGHSLESITSDQPLPSNLLKTDFPLEMQNVKNKKKIENTLFPCGYTLLKLELLCSLNSQSVERPLKMPQFNGAKPHSDNLTIPGSLFGHILGPIHFLAWWHPFINGDGIATEKSSRSTAIFFSQK